MKKRLLSILLIISVTVSLLACGTSDAPVEETDEADVIEVDENLITMEISIPAEYLEEGITQEQIDEEVGDAGFISGTLNEDGSATYVMTKGAHKKFMKEMAKEYSVSLDALVGSEDYPKFTAIEYNDDFTNFTITTTSTELDFGESFSVLLFFMYGAIYNNFNGTPVENIHVDYVNADSGEIISSSDSINMDSETDVTE